MKIETPADAFAALAVLVVGADQVGTLEERRFLFERLSAHSVFGDLDGEAFAALVGDTTEQLHTSLPTADGRVTDEGVSRAVGMIAGALTPELCTEAFRMAVDLARIDGMVRPEEAMLERVRDGLGIDPTRAAELMAPPRQA
jgi:tellurite resistance protein